MAVCVVFECLALLCLAADNWPYGSASFGVEKENTAVACMVFLQGYKVYVYGCVCWCVYCHSVSGLFLILVFEADKMVTGLLHQGRHGGKRFHLSVPQVTFIPRYSLFTNASIVYTSCLMVALLPLFNT